jgi:hypothetical protein
MSRELGCAEPLELDLSKEPIVRQYGVALDLALRDDRGLIRTYEGYLARIFGVDLGSYIVHHAMTDARDLADIPGTDTIGTLDS